MTQLCHRGPLSAQLHPYGALSLSLFIPCLQGLSAAPQVRPSPLQAVSCSQWARRSKFGSGKTSTSPWQSSRPLRGEPRRGLHSTYPPLKRDALCRDHQSSDSSSQRGAPHSRAPLGLQHHAPARCSPRTPALCVLGPPLTDPVRQAAPCYSAPSRHALCFVTLWPRSWYPLFLSCAPHPIGAAYDVSAPPFADTSICSPPQHIAATGHPLFSRHSYHVRPLNTVPGHPLSRPRHRSRRRHSSGTVPHVSDGHRPVRRC